MANTQTYFEWHGGSFVDSFNDRIAGSAEQDQTSRVCRLLILLFNLP